MLRGRLQERAESSKRWRGCRRLLELDPPCRALSTLPGCPLQLRTQSEASAVSNQDSWTPPLPAPTTAQTLGQGLVCRASQTSNRGRKEAALWFGR